MVMVDWGFSPRVPSLVPFRDGRRGLTAATSDRLVVLRSLGASSSSKFHLDCFSKSCCCCC